MPIDNLEYIRLGEIENNLNKIGYSKHILKVIDVCTKDTNKTVIKSIKKTGTIHSIFNWFKKTKVFKWLNQHKLFNDFFKWVKNNKNLNGIVNFADQFLSVDDKIKKLSFYNSLSTCGLAATVSSFCWGMLENFNLIPKEKSLWMKIVEG